MNRFPFLQPRRLASALCMLGLLCLSPACSSNTSPAADSATPAAAAATAAASSTATPASGAAMSTAAFIKMAKESPCHQTRNQLYLIDNSVVFWDRIGNCPDNAHEQTLFGASPDTVLITSRDSIAGPRTTVNDEKYRAMFDTIMANREVAGLGLGSAHKVQVLAL